MSRQQALLYNLLNPIFTEEQNELFRKYAWYSTYTSDQMLEISIAILDGLPESILKEMSREVKKGAQHDTLMNIRHRVIIDRECSRLKGFADELVEHKLSEITGKLMEIAGDSETRMLETLSGISSMIDTIGHNIEQNKDQTNSQIQEKAALLLDLIAGRNKQKQTDLEDITKRLADMCQKIDEILYQQKRKEQRHPYLDADLSLLSGSESGSGTKKREEDLKVFGKIKSFFLDIRNRIYQNTKKYKEAEKERLELMRYICSIDLDEEQLCVIRTAVNSPQLTLEDIKVVAEESLPAEMMLSKLALMIQIKEAQIVSE